MKIRYIVIAVLVWGSFEPLHADTVSDPDEYTILAAGGSYQINIVSDEDWELIARGDWASVEPSSGSGNATVTVTVDANDTGWDRSNTIVVVSSSRRGSIHEIHQYVLGTAIDLASKDVNYFATNYRIEIASDSPWSVSGLPDWVSVEPLSGEASGEVTVSVLENQTEFVRESNFQIGGLSHTLHQAVRWSVSPSEMVVGAVSGNYTIRMVADGSWTVSNALPEWLSLSAVSGEGNSDILLEYAENDTNLARSAYFYIGGERHDISQEAGAVPVVTEIAPENITIQSFDTRYTVDVLSNSPWNVSGVPEWAWISPSNGGGDGELRVYPDQNTSKADREATLVIGGIEHHLVQKGLNIATLNPYTKAVGPGVGEYTIYLDTKGEWDLTIRRGRDGYWASVLPESGVGPAEIAVTYEALPDTSAREQVIIFEVIGDNVIHTLTQQVEEIDSEIDPQSQEIGAEGGLYTISVATNQLWERGSLPDWVGITTSRLSEDGDITVVVDENPYPESRFAVFDIAGVPHTLIQRGVGVDALSSSYSLAIETTSIDQSLQLRVSGLVPGRSYVIQTGALVDEWHELMRVDEVSTLADVLIPLELGFTGFVRVLELE